MFMKQGGQNSSASVRYALTKLFCSTQSQQRFAPTWTSKLIWDYRIYFWKWRTGCNSQQLGPKCQQLLAKWMVSLACLALPDFGYRNPLQLLVRLQMQSTLQQLCKTLSSCLTESRKKSDWRLLTSLAYSSDCKVTHSSWQVQDWLLRRRIQDILYSEVHKKSIHTPHLSLTTDLITNIICDISTMPKHKSWKIYRNCSINKLWR